MTHRDHVETKSIRTAGDRIGSWTFETLVEDGPRASLRRWRMRCQCGYASLRWEDEVSHRSKACVTCANAARRAAK